MTITFGHRQLIVALVGTSHRVKKLEYPQFQEATDAEVAYFATRPDSVEERRRNEANVALYGGPFR
ncbi:MAG: hypothetical protein ACJ789_00800 [Thermomicrobiales bacterium]